MHHPATSSAIGDYRFATPASIARLLTSPTLRSHAIAPRANRFAPGAGGHGARTTGGQRPKTSNRIPRIPQRDQSDEPQNARAALLQNAAGPARLICRAPDILPVQI
jgi:hypothetical protein